MKSFIIAAIIAAAILQAPGVVAQKIKKGDVPVAVLSAFQKYNPGKTAGWEKEKRIVPRIAWVSYPVFYAGLLALFWCIVHSGLDKFWLMLLFFL